MKNLIILLLIFISTEVVSQTTRDANIEIPILVFDNSGYSESSQLLTCGIDSMATDSIDILIGEYWLNCALNYFWNNSDCPPYDHFEAAFNLLVSPPPGTFLWGSYKDFRYGMIPYSNTKTYEINYVTWDIATAVFISWDFPEGVTGLLQDSFGGAIFNYQMPDSGTFTHPSLIQLQGANVGVHLVLTYQNTIPVELTFFNAKVVDNNIELNWSTATETNNSGFEILRFTTNKEEWEKVGFIPGYGTTTKTQSYSFTDSDVNPGSYIYRLKQIDYDGTFEYSKTVEVDVIITNNLSLRQNFPNPFNPSTKIKYQIPELSFVTIKVYDVLGTEITTLVNEEKSIGSYEVEFKAKNLPSGVYFYKLQAGSTSKSPPAGRHGSGQRFVETKKMVLLR